MVQIDPTVRALSPDELSVLVRCTVRPVAYGAVSRAIAAKLVDEGWVELQDMPDPRHGVRRNVMAMIATELGRARVAFDH
jgi:hypothetical protein